MVMISSFSSCFTRLWTCFAFVAFERNLSIKSWVCLISRCWALYCKVVGNHQNGAGVVDEVAFHPFLGIDIEVVGWFVQQEDFGLLEEKFSQGDAHLPSAGELAAVACEVGALKSKTREDRFDSGFDPPGVGILKFKLVQDRRFRVKHRSRGRSVGRGHGGTQRVGRCLFGAPGFRRRLIPPHPRV